MGASTDPSSVGVSALLGLTTGNLFDKWLGTDQSSGVDYNALAGQVNAMALTGMDAATGANQFNQNAYQNSILPSVTNQLGVSQTAANSALQQSQLMGGYAMQDRAKASQFNPATAQFAQEVTNYGTAEDQERAAGKASQAALAQSQAAKSAAMTQLNDMGVDISSGKVASALMQANMQGATAAAAAANDARESTRQAGVNARASAVGMGNTLTNTANNTAGQAAAMGAQAANTAGTGVQNAIAGANLATSGTSDIINAANVGVTGNLGLARAQTQDAATFAELNNQSSAGVGAGTQAAVAAAGPIVNWVGDAVGDIAGWAWDGITEWWDS